MVRSFGGAACTLHSSITRRHIAMSHFYSLDDDEGGAAGPSDHGSQVQSGLSSLSPPSSRSGAESRGNPIYAMLDGETASRVDGDDGDANGMRVSDAEDAHGKRRSEPPIMLLQRAWVAERAAPEILAWEGDAVDDVCSQIEEQMVRRRRLWMRWVCQVRLIHPPSDDCRIPRVRHLDGRGGACALGSGGAGRGESSLASQELPAMPSRQDRAACCLSSTASTKQGADVGPGKGVLRQVRCKNDLSVSFPLAHALHFSLFRFAKLQSKHYQNAVLDFLPANLRSLEDKSESGTDGRGDMGASCPRRPSLLF